MATITLFSFGYWGWGSATTQLVQAFDAVEAVRGFAPPMFVDIRVSRSVRAKGFDGSAFEKVAGATRYQWINALGNAGVLDGGEMRIKDPAAASTLLDIAQRCATNGQRVVFFCGCPRPAPCHRSVVTRLVLDEATRRKLSIDITEWPGGEPQFDGLEIRLSRAEFDKVRRGAKTIPLGDRMQLSESGAVPYYSLVAVRPLGDEEGPSWRLVTGPAMYNKNGWYLPVYGVFDDEPPDFVRAEIQRAREGDGYQARQTQM